MRKSQTFLLIGWITLLSVACAYAAFGDAPIFGFAGFTLAMLLLPRRRHRQPAGTTAALMPLLQLAILILVVVGFVYLNLRGANNGHNQETWASFEAWQFRPLVALAFWILGLASGYRAFGFGIRKDP
ncbi:MAG: hypothetical protein H7A20_11840 [Rhodanobacteraceae bacterium]|nr:hypothetical protein [Rhodanobacteraceae bacterium]